MNILGQKRVLNVGSLNIDRVFRVPHLVRGGETLASPVAGGVLAGGKGANQSIALARAGAAVSHCGKVGPDGVWLIEKLTGEGIDTRLVASSTTPTGQAHPGRGRWPKRYRAAGRGQPRARRH